MTVSSPSAPPSLLKLELSAVGELLAYPGYWAGGWLPESMTNAEKCQAVTVSMG